MKGGWELLFWFAVGVVLTLLALNGLVALL